MEPLAILAARVSDSSKAVVVASSRPLGVGTEVELAALTEAQVAELTGESRPDVVRAIWAAARGMPGVAGSLAAHLTTLPPDADPVVALALRAEGGVEFLDVDAPVIRLIEIALEPGHPPGRPGCVERPARPRADGGHVDGVAAAGAALTKRPRWPSRSGIRGCRRR